MHRAQAAELCDLVARLSDVVEALAQDAGRGKEVSRLQNIRADVLRLKSALGRNDGSYPGTERKGWFRRTDLSLT